MIVLGSHLDQLKNKDVIEDKHVILDSFCQSTKKYKMEAAFFMSDCCQPRSRQILDIQRHVASLTSISPHELSLNSSILLGLLEKDFSHVIACPVKTIVSHIKESGISLPQNAAALSSILSELHETGLLLMIDNASKLKEDVQVVLKISKLTNEVHEMLFSKNAISRLKEPTLFGSHCSSLNVGIVPEKLLLSILPPYITKECLVHLQFCQEIKYSDIGLFPSFPVESDSLEQSLLFFPVLCSVYKGNGSLSTPSDFTYTIGWLAECEDSHDFFPPRFLHVLLLQILLRFTLSESPFQTDTGSGFPERHFQRLCQMWKSGVQWLMEEGVECMVELVDTNRRVVVITKSDDSAKDNCIHIFNQVIKCVMEVKDEFCPFLNPRYYLLDSTDPDDYLNRDNLFDMRKVINILTSPQNKKVVISTTGTRTMKRSRLECIRQLTHWYSLFPIDFHSVIPYFGNIVRGIHDLCLHLDIPLSFLKTLEENYPRDVERRKTELVWKWMCSTSNPPCWWRLAETLKKMGEMAEANEVEKIYSEFL